MFNEGCIRGTKDMSFKLKLFQGTSCAMYIKKCPAKLRDIKLNFYDNIFIDLLTFAFEFFIIQGEDD